MSHNRGNRRGNFGKGSGGGGRFGGPRRVKDADHGTVVDENNPVVQCFREYARELDEKHDRYETIVKSSRDITIESKRIIFLLHTVDAKKNNVTKVCDEAKTRLDALFRTHFCAIATELQGLDPYQYSRAYTAGMQEFIEAYTFYEYTSGKEISHWKTLEEQLKYKVPVNKPAAEQPEGTPAAELVEIKCLLHPRDYVLGLGDLSGEVMRKCVNSLGSGDVDSCFDHRRFMQQLYRCFLSVSSVHNRDFFHKLSTLRQSLLKSENVCYNVRVRGGEAAKWGSTEDETGPKDNRFEDEGVFF